MQPAFVVTNGGLDESLNYIQLYRTKEQALSYARLMRINASHNVYEISVPEGEESISVMFTHVNKTKMANYVESQAECTKMAMAYYKDQYREYLSECYRTKSCDYKHLRIKSCVLFQPNCSILQLFSEHSHRLSFSCFSDVEYCEE